MKNHMKPEAGYTIIFRPWITTRSGRRIYPRRGRVFCLKIRISKEA